MDKSLRVIVFFLAFSLLPFAGFATHIVGGEMYYKYLGNNQYEIRLTVYRDCRNGIPPYDYPASVGIFDTAHHLVNVAYQYTGYYPQGSNVYYNNATFNNLNYGFLMYPRDSETVPNIITAPCVIPPVDICYRVCHYIDTVSLPFIPGGYELVYMRCCRNNSINNIINPGGTGGTYILDIPDSSIVINNGNPVFNNLPPTFVCVGLPFTFDHSATDPNGDSMHYHLCVPIDGPDSICFHNNACCQTQAQPCSVEPQPPFNPTYIPIVWQNPYNLANLFGGTPLTINPVNGLLTATPSTTGQFVYGVCVDEYRNGVFLGETKRDYQINVVNCQLETVASIQSPLITCGTDLALFQNNSTGAINKYHWDFGVAALTNDTSNLTNPLYTYPDTGTFTVQLIAYDSLSPNCNDTSYGTVQILPPFIGGFKDSIAPCTNLVAFHDTTHSYDGNPNKWRWFFGDGGLDSVKNPSHIYASGGGTDTVTFIVITAKGCVDTIRQLVTFPKLVKNKFTDSISCADNCNGTAEVSSDGGSSPYTYQWSTVPMQFGPSATNLCPGWVYVTVTDANGCSHVDSILVKSYINNADSYASANPDTIFNFQSTTLGVNPSSGYIYTWSPSAGLSTTSSPNPIANPTYTTTYYVSVTDPNGCGQVVDSIHVVVLTLHCDATDIYVPNAFTPDGNGHNDVLYVRSRGLATLFLAIYNRWGQKVFETTDITKGWDGTYNGSPVAPDVFDYYLEATCINGKTYFKKGNITLIR